MKVRLRVGREDSCWESPTAVHYLENLLGDAIDRWRAARWERLKAKEELSFKLDAHDKAPAAHVGERPRRVNAHGADAGRITKRLDTFKRHM